MRTTSVHRRLTLGVLLAVVAGTTPAAVASAGAPEAAQEAPTLRLIVRGHPGAGSDMAMAAVENVGGAVTDDLPIVDGVAAEVPSGSLGELTSSPQVRSVSENRTVAFQATGAGSAQVRSVYPASTGADQMWRTGTTGRGVTVAVVDSGIAPVPDLAGRIVEVTDSISGRRSPCVDLSGEGTCADTFGHGTFMAGMIAGDGTASGGRWSGMAPDAELLSVKIAGADGSSDVSKALAAIQWVVSSKDTYDIGVLNLSLGTNSTQSWEVDPFNYAVQRAWAAGITVVVSASNRGPDPGTIAKPGDDPWVITVGSVDDRGTRRLADDRVPDHSSRGPTLEGLAKPDVAAPGAHVVSLRSPGSTIDEQYPNVIDGSYRQGSGTSMATAVVAGAAALLLQDDPARAPGDVKGALMASARPTAGHLPPAVGAGTIDTVGAAEVPAGAATTSGPGRSSGMGSLDASRGDVRVRADNLLGTVVSRPLTAQLVLWDPIGFVTGNWSASTWPQSTWALSRWYRTTWYGDIWAGVEPTGLNWHGSWEGSTSGSGHHDDTYGDPSFGAAWFGVWE